MGNLVYIHINGVQLFYLCLCLANILISGCQLYFNYELCKMGGTLFYTKQIFLAISLS